MANKIGKLLKEAREAAGFTQTELSKKAKTVTASEISKAERGELRLSSLITSLTGEKEKEGKKTEDAGFLGNILQSAAKDLLK